MTRKLSWLNPHVSVKSLESLGVLYNITNVLQLNDKIQKHSSTICATWMENTLRQMHFLSIMIQHLSSLTVCILCSLKNKNKPWNRKLLSVVDFYNFYRPLWTTSDFRAYLFWPRHSVCFNSILCYLVRFIEKMLEADRNMVLW